MNFEKEAKRLSTAVREDHKKIGELEQAMDKSKQEIEALKNKILEQHPEMTEKIKKHNQIGEEWNKLVTSSSANIKELIYLGVKKDV